MAENTNRLQFVHCDTLFATSKEAMDYVNSKIVDERCAMYAEPMVLKYGDASNPNILLAIGSKGDGETIDTAKEVNNKVFFIDLAKVNESIEELSGSSEGLETLVQSINASCGFNDKGEYVGDKGDEIIGDADDLTEAISLLSQYVKALDSKTQFDVIDSDTIDFTLEKSSKGSKLKGDVKVPETKVINRVVTKNDIITDENGIFTNVQMACESTDDGQKLSLIVNGEVVNTFIIPTELYITSGKYNKETEEVILTRNDGEEIKINVTDLIEEWTVLGEDSSTPIVLKKTHNIYDKSKHVEKWQDVLVADVRLSEDEDNILERDDRGESLIVRGVASNIKYGDTTVADALDNAYSEIAEGSVIRLRGDGLYADIQLDYNPASNTLIFKKTQRDSANLVEKEISLNSVKFIKEARYDATTETLIVVFVNESGEDIEIKIPVKDLIEEYKPLNTNHNVYVEIKRGVDGASTISADAQRSTAPDNILTEIDHKLYVGGVSQNIKYGEGTVKDALDLILGDATEKGSIKNLISEEAAERQKADANLSDAIDTKADKTYADEINEHVESLQDYADIVSGNSATEGSIKNAIEKSKEYTNEVADTKADKTELNKVNEHVESLQDYADIVSGNSATEGSIKNAIEKSKEYTDTVADTKTDKTTTNELIERVNTLQDYASVVSGNSATEGSIANAIEKSKTYTDTVADTKADKTELESVNDHVSELQSYADIVSGNSATEGSIANAIKKANDYTDTKITDLSTTTEAKIKEVSDAVTAETKARQDAISETNNNVEKLEVRVEKNEGDIADLAEKIDDLDGKAITSVTMVQDADNNLKYTLYVDGDNAGVINIPKDQFLKNVTYSSETKSLIFEFETTDGTKRVEVKVDDLVDTYTASDGLTLTDNAFSVKVDRTSENYLTVSEYGVKVSGIDAVVNELDTKITTETTNLSNAITNVSGVVSSHTTTIAEIQTELEEVAQDSVTAVTIDKNEYDSLEYILNVNGQPVSKINIPKDQFLKSVEYNELTKSIDFVFETSDGEKKVSVDMSDLIDTYNAGNGLSLTNSTFDVVVDRLSENYLTVSENGIKISGIDSALNNKTDVTTTTAIDERLKDVEKSVETLEGDSLTKGSLLWGIESAKTYTNQSVSSKTDISATTAIDERVKALESGSSINIQTAIESAKTYTNDYTYSKSESDNKYASKTYEPIVEENVQAIEKLQNSVNSLSGTVNSMQTTYIDTPSIDFVVETNENGGKNVFANVKKSATNGNTLKTIDDGVYVGNTKLTYDTAYNQITFVDNNGEESLIKLNSASVVKDMSIQTIDSVEYLVITYDDETEPIKVKIADFFKGIVGSTDGNVTTTTALTTTQGGADVATAITANLDVIDIIDNTLGDVILTKTQENKITANAHISEIPNNWLESDGNSLYVMAKDASDIKYEGDTSVGDKLGDVTNSITEINNNITEISTKLSAVTDNTERIIRLEFASNHYETILGISSGETHIDFEGTNYLDKQHDVINSLKTLDSEIKSNRDMITELSAYVETKFAEIAEEISRLDAKSTLYDASSTDEGVFTFVRPNGDEKTYTTDEMTGIGFRLGTTDLDQDIESDEFFDDF